MPVNHRAFIVNQVPFSLVAAILVRASDWLSVFELLLYICHDLVAVSALESAVDQLWLGVCGSGHRSVN